MYIYLSLYVKSCESQLDSLILWSIPPSRRLIGILLGGQKAKLNREDLHLPDRLTDYSCVSNATIYESNFHGYLHILSPVPCLVLMRPLRDERMCYCYIKG